MPPVPEARREVLGSIGSRFRSSQLVGANKAGRRYVGALYHEMEGIMK